MTNEQLAACIKAGEDVAGNMARLYEQTKAFIHVTALKYQRYAELDDLEQEGYLALYDAVDGFNPAAGCLFLTYARHWIRQRIVRYIQNNGTVRVPVHEWERLAEYRKFENAFLSRTGRRPAEGEIRRFMGLGLKQFRQLEKTLNFGRIRSLDSPLTEADDATIEDTVRADVDVESTVLDEVQAEQMCEAVWGAVDSLEGQQADVIRARFQRGLSLREVGEGMGVTVERVRQIEGKALRELRRPGPAGKLQPFLPDSMGSRAYSGSTESFHRTWTSSTERVALKL